MCWSHKLILFQNISAGPLEGSGLGGVGVVGDKLVASAASGGGGDDNEFSFKTIEISGQTDVVADSDADTLTLVAAGGMTMTTSADTITLTSANDNTTYGSYSGSSPGLIPIRDSGSTTGKYMREDGDWVIPPDTNTNTTYSGGTGLTLSSTTFNVDASQTQITSVGTIGTGVWSGTALVAGKVPAHDSLTGFVANEHLDWTSSVGTIHSGNYTNTTYSVGDGGLTTNNFTDADHTKLNGIAASANNYSHSTNANLTGDVTSSGNATTIATDAVDIAMLSASGTASSSTFLRGDNSWVTPTDTNTTYSVTDGQLSEFNFTSADHTKLNGIASSANNYSHPTGAGNNHVPTGGSSDQVLTYSSSGVEAWADADGGGGGGVITATANGVNNRIATYSAATALNGEASLIFDGTTLTNSAGGIVDSNGQVMSALGMDQGAAIHGLANTSFGSGTLLLSFAAGPSDERLKREISNIEYGLAEIKAITPKWFKYNETTYNSSGLALPIPTTHEHKDAYYNAQRTGFMAGDVKTVMPKIVSLMEDDKDYETYDKDALIFVLINAVKELEARVTTLEG